MDIVGKSDRPVDRVNSDENLSVVDLMKLAQRLNETASGEQYFFREIELDCAFRLADIAYNAALRTGAPEAIAHATRVRSLVFLAHDLVGVRELDKAVGALEELMDVLAEVHP